MSTSHSSTALLPASSDVKVDAIASLLSLFERATINMEESLANSVKSSIVICLKFVDKRSLFTSLLPNTFIDWDYVANAGGMGLVVVDKKHLQQQQQQQQPPALPSSTTSAASSNFSLISSLTCLGVAAGKKINMLGDSSVWLQLMQFLDFGDLKIPERVLQSKYPPLFCMYNTIQSQMKGYPEKNRLNFSDACKLLLLNNVEGLTSRNVLELYTSSRLNQNTYALCSHILSTLADERHSSDVYQETFRYVLSQEVMKVNEDLLAKYIQHFRSTSAARRKAWEMKYVQNRSCRPSMRKIASRSSSAAGQDGAMYMHGSASNDDAMSVSSLATATTSASSTAAGASLGVSSMTFEQHSSLIRYPNSMSNLRRLRCYLMACQHHNFDYSKYMDDLVSKDVAAALKNNPVIFPDAHSVHLAIESLAMNIIPFEELNQFRVRCFLSFASHQKKNLSLTQVLKLYVAAYQSKAIWKQVWTRVFPVISPQIIRDVETFVSATPFAVEPFVRIVKTSSPFST